MTKTTPAPPAGAGPAGRRLWRAVLGTFELAEHELTLLRQACRAADRCDELDRVLAVEGPLTTSRLGESKTHPAATEQRQQALALARLVVALRVPLADAEDGQKSAVDAARLQRRGMRGFYGGRA